MGAPWSSMFPLLSPSLSHFLPTQVCPGFLLIVGSRCCESDSTSLLICSHYHLRVLPHGPRASAFGVLCIVVSLYRLFWGGEASNFVPMILILQLILQDPSYCGWILCGHVLILTCLGELGVLAADVCFVPLQEFKVSLPCTDLLMSLPEVLAMRINQSASLDTGIWCHLCTGGGVCADLREFWQDKVIRQTISTSSLPAWTVETSPTWVALSVFCWVGTTY